jgi:predicted metal-dependent phosphotriesterase family hydrolase
VFGPPSNVWRRVAVTWPTPGRHVDFELRSNIDQSYLKKLLVSSQRKKNFWTLSTLLHGTHMYRYSPTCFTTLFSYFIPTLATKGMRFTRVHTLAISNLPANKFVQSATVAKLVKNKIQVEISRQNLN